MSRLNDAWLVLLGRVERTREVVKEVPVCGEAREVSVYRAFSREGSIFSSFGLIDTQHSEWNGRAYRSCADAFAAHPDANIVCVTVWEIGGKFYDSPRLVEIPFDSKAKRGKGRKS